MLKQWKMCINNPALNFATGFKAVAAICNFSSSKAHFNFPLYSASTPDGSYSGGLYF